MASDSYSIVLSTEPSSDWAEELGYTPEGLAEMNHKAIDLLREVGQEFESDQSKMVLSGCLGPREDAYLPPQWSDDAL
jgi:hypothetical protein